MPTMASILRHPSVCAALTFTRRPLVWAAFAAGCSSVTTFLLWFLGRQVPAVESFEQAVLLHADAAYIGRLWVNFVHVFIALAAYGAVAAVMRKRAPVASAIGFVSFAFWALSEALGVAVNLFGVNRLWRAGYGDADEATRALIRGSIHTFQGVWEGIFFVVLVTFLIGTLAFAWALFRGDWTQRSLAALFGLAGPLTLVIVLDGYFGFSLSGWIQWSYPILQPMSRAWLGIWLLQMARRDSEDVILASA